MVVRRIVGTITRIQGIVQIQDAFARLVGRKLLYRDLIADNGLSSGSGA